MGLFTVFFEEYEKAVQVEAGTTLLAAAAGAGIEIYSPCSGRGICGKCRVSVDGADVLACRYTVASDITVKACRTDAVMLGDSGLRVFETDGTCRFAAAFDIGTTSVAGFIMDGKSGRTLASGNRLNPQASFGSDLISRIQQSIKGRSEQLQDVIVSCISEMILSLSDSCSVDPSDIGCVAVAGNTAMLHLFMGKDPKPLTVPPYMPLSASSEEFTNNGWLPAADDAVIRILPCIAGFVGGDTAGCMLSCGFDEAEDTTLLIDIGTNGEMVLGNKDRFCACSTAAGPAFEGAGIAYGMIASPGAISHVRAVSGKLECDVIGGGEARGICGSGLLDAVSCLLEIGALDDSGRMEPDGSGNWTISDGVPAYILRDGVSVTQKDIRQLQLAKGAIRAGIELLCRHLGKKPEEIGKVLLAGAFGNYLDPSSACRIGMIPQELAGRIVPVGNAAGDGARMCSLSAAQFARCSSAAASCEFIELASLDDFQDTFVENMLF